MGRGKGKGKGMGEERLRERYTTGARGCSGHLCTKLVHFMSLSQKLNMYNVMYLYNMHCSCAYRNISRR